MSRKFHFLSVNSSYSHSSTALPMLHQAALNIPDWQWTQTECTILSDPSEIAIEIAAVKPDIIGCTLYLFNRAHVMNILGRFHALLPQTRIVLGGPECTHDSGREILDKYPFVHTVFVGESEGIFAEYLAEFPLPESRGILPQDSRAIYDDWDKDQIVSDDFFRTDKPFVQYETSRGCPIGCKYCTSANILLRLKDLVIVERDLEILYAKGVREIRLLDRTFNYPQWRGAALLRLFRERFPEMEFHLEIHPHFINDELKKELEIAPNLHIEAGIQSLDENVQRAIGRNSKKQAVLDGVGFLASCNNFETHADLICGLPEQRLETVFEDAVSLMKLNVAEVQLETLKILNGTPLQSLTSEYDIVYSPEPPYDVMRTGYISAEEIIYARKLSRIIDLFYNHHVLHNIIRALDFQRGDDLKKFTDFMLGKGIALNSVADLKKRVLYLTDFVKIQYNDDAAFEISKVWIEQGYPLKEIPFGIIQKYTDEMPEGTACEAKEIFFHPESKLWRMICGKHVLNFAVNRHFKLNGAAFIW